MTPDILSSKNGNLQFFNLAGKVVKNGPCSIFFPTRMLPYALTCIFSNMGCF
jgi:hypothetical protein